ncbi:MAG: hypothetical protein AAFR99_05685 [Cyanobacteria bacterium J06629_9]
MNLARQLLSYDYGDLVQVRRSGRVYRAMLIDVGLDSLLIRYPSGYTCTVPAAAATVVKVGTIFDLITERERVEAAHRLPDWRPGNEDYDRAISLMDANCHNRPL